MAALSRAHPAFKFGRVGDVSSQIMPRESLPYETDGEKNGLSQFAGSARPFSAKPMEEDGGKVAVQCRYHKLFLYSLAAFGLFHPFRFSDVGARLRAPLVIYSSLILMLLFLNSVREMLTSFAPYESDMAAILYIPRLTFLAWHLVTTIALAIQYLVCFAKQRGAAGYYSKLNETMQILYDAGMPISLKRKRKLELCCLAVGWVLYVVNACYSLPTVADRAQFATTESVLRWRVDNVSTASEYEAMRWVEFVAMTYGTGAYIFPVVYILVICGHLSIVLDAFNDKLGEIADSQPVLLLERVGFYRRLYSRICDTMASANGVVDFMVAVHLAVNFLLTILQLFFVMNISSLKEYSQLKTSAVIWFLTACAVIVAEFAAGCLVTEKAKACEEHLGKISDDSPTAPTTHQVIQLQLFLNQLKQDKGFDVIGLFPINREAVIPLLGAWVTYFLLVSQFTTSPPGSADASATNGTNRSLPNSNTTNL